MSASNVQRLLWGLYGLCALLFLADFFVAREGRFVIDGVIGFYPLVGLAAAALLLLAAGPLRRLLTRPEDYYDR